MAASHHEQRRARRRGRSLLAGLTLTGGLLGCADLPGLDGLSPDPFSTDDAGTSAGGGWGDGDPLPGSDASDDQADSASADGGSSGATTADATSSAGSGADDGAPSTGEGEGLDGLGLEEAGDEGASDEGRDGDEGGDDPELLAAAQAGLRLVEILPDPTGKDGVDGPEFVELLALGTQAVPLAGLRLEARSWPLLDLGERLAPLTEIASGTRLVVSRWASGVNPASVPDLDPEDGVIHALFASSAGLRNTDGGVLVRAADGTVIDAVSYGAAQPEPFPSLPSVDAPDAGEALCRVESAPPTQLTRTALDEVPWGRCVASPGAASAPPTPPGAGLALVEYHPHHGPLHPSGENNEFIELLVTSGNSLDLALQLRIGGVVRPLEPLWTSDCSGQPCALPGQRVLLVGDQYVGPFEVAPILFVPTVYLGGEGPIAPNPEIRVERLDGTLVTSLGTWGDPAVWPSAPEGDASLHRLLPSEPDVPEAWGWAGPTPHLP